MRFYKFALVSLFALAALLLGADSAHAGDATLNPNQDTYLRKGQPNKNFGADSILRIRSSGKNRALVQFDQSAIAAAVGTDGLISATLELTITANGDNWGPSGRTIDVHRMTRSWLELGATWNTSNDTDTSNSAPDGDPNAEWEMDEGQPTSVPFKALASASATIANGQTGTVSFDVTGDVAAFLSGTATNLGWLIKKTEEGQSGRIELGSRETGTPPKLVLQFAPGVDSAPPSVTVASPADGTLVANTGPLATVTYTDVSGVNPATATATLDGIDVTSLITADGTQATIPLDQAPNAPLSVGDHTLVFSIDDNAGNAGQATSTFTVGDADLGPTGDTYVKQGQKNKNFGAELILRIRQSGKNRALIQFDQAAITAAAAGRTIQTAILEVEITDNGNNWGASGRTVDAHRMKQQWTELGATWNTGIDTDTSNSSPDGDPADEWTMGGSDPNVRPFDPTATDGQTIANGQSGVVRFDITSDIADFLAGTEPNYGHILKKTDEGQSGRIEFGPRETTTPPRLILLFQDTGVDVTPPTVTIVTPADGSDTNDSGPDALVTYSDAGSGIDSSTFTATLDGNDVTSIFTATGTQATADLGSAPAAPLTEGTHTLAVTVDDVAGNTGSDSSTFVVDLTAPTITIDSPTEGQLVTTTTPTITGTFSDALTGVDVASFTITVAGNDLTAFATVTATGFTLVVPTPLAQGSIQATATIDDLAGNQANAVRNFTVDSVAPTLTIDDPTEGQVVTTQTPTITGTYDDATSGVAVASFTINIDGNDFTSSATTNATGFSLTPTALGEGPHTITATVTDNAGNLSTTVRNFTVDSVAPTLTIDSPTEGEVVATATPTITGSYSDVSPGIDVSSFTIDIDGNDLTASATTNATGFTLVVPTALGEGPHLITATVQDLSGNQTTTLRNFVTDTIAPTIDVTFPTEAALLNTPQPAIVGVYADGGSGVDVSTFTIDIDTVPFTASTSPTGFTLTPPAPLAQGSHTITATIEDFAGNSASVVRTFTLDSVAPVFAFSPANGDTVTTSTPEIVVTLTDPAPASGIDTGTVQLVVDSIDVTAQATITATEARFTPATPLVDGTHLVEIFAADNAGNVGSDSAVFTVATAPTGAPSVHRVTPPDMSTGAFIDTQVVVDFDPAVPADPLTVTTSTVFITPEGSSTPVPATVTYDGSTCQAFLTPSADLALITSFTLTITTGVQAAADSTPLAATFNSEFETGNVAGLADDDNDGLLNLEEAEIGTNPGAADSDTDGIDDLDEINNGTDPTDSDTDNDGLLDGADPEPLTPDPSGPDVEGPFSVSYSPNRVFGVDTSTPFKIKWNEPIDVSSIIVSDDFGTGMSTANILIASSPPVSVVMTVADGGRLLCFSAPGGWPAGGVVSVGFGDFGSNPPIRDLSGNPVTESVSTFFTTRTITPTTRQFEQIQGGLTVPNRYCESFDMPAMQGIGRNGLPSGQTYASTVGEHNTPPDAGKNASDCICYEEVRKNGKIEVIITGGLRVQGSFGPQSMLLGDQGLFSVLTTRTGSDRQSCFGPWRFSYDAQFIQEGANFRFVHHDGREDVYTDDGLGGFVSPPGYYDDLTLDGSLLRVRKRDGTRFVYDLTKDGLLVERRDRVGNVTQFVRKQQPSGAWVMDKIVDEIGRETVFSYHTDPGKEDLVATIVDWDNRTWEYDYDATTRDLVSIKSPASDFIDETGTPVVNQSKTFGFTYTSGNADNRLNHSLTSVTDGRGKTISRIFYDDDDHVTQIDYGAGTAFYGWEWDAAGFEPTSFDEIDRAGNLTRFFIDSNGDVSSVEEHTGDDPVRPGEDPPSFIHKFKYDSDTEVVEIERPEGNVIRLIRDDRGFVNQMIRKTSQTSDPDTDIVYTYKLDPDFCKVTRYTEPRGNTPPVAHCGTPEDVTLQTPRTFVVDDPAQRDALTHYFFYDHEDIGGRLAAESAEMGVTVTLSGTLPPTWGRPLGIDPPDQAVFDPDSDGVLDFGGNQYACRAPRPLVVDPDNPSQFQVTRQVIESFNTFNQRGQPIFHIDPGGDRHRNEWYPGTFDATTNPNAGFLRLMQADSSFAPSDVTLSTGVPAIGNPGTNLDLTTEFVYTSFGNVTEVTNPRGFTTSLEVNDLNLTTKVTASAPFSYERIVDYDGSNNVVAVRVQNVIPNDSNDNGVQDGVGEQQLGTTSFFVHTSTYNDVNRLIETTRDATGSTPALLTTQIERDFKQRVIRVIQPELNFHDTVYDERDLVFQTLTGASDSTVVETTRYDYDRNANLIEIIDDDGNADPDVVVTYDLFDRPVLSTNEIGNSVETIYDPASLVRQRIFRGQKSGSAGETTTTVLAQLFADYDELQRPFQSDAAYFKFDPLSGDAISAQDGPLTPPAANLGSLDASISGVATLVSALTIYDAQSLVTHVIDDNVHSTSFAHDGADRLVTHTDHIGSVNTYTYDDNSNVIRVQEDELDQDSLSVETFVSEVFYDELDRVIASVSPLGNTARFLYDSRSNLIQRSDAVATTGPLMSSLPLAAEHGVFPQGDLSVNRRGNTIIHAYDGVSRRLSTVRELRADGTGDTLVVSTITTGQTWDGNSRRRTRTDDNNNTTSYLYDHKNRQFSTQFADGTFDITTYNPVDTVSSYRDARGVLQEFGYDAVERRIDATISNLPVGRGQTSFLGYAHDGLDRITRAEDNDSICVLGYDSLSRRVLETETVGTGAARSNKTQALAGVTRSTQSAFDGVGNRTQLTYPSGRVINYTFDEVDRVNQIIENATAAIIADYRYIGMGQRRVSRAFGNGTTLSLEYDGERRVTRHDHRRDSDNQRVRGFEHAWDRANNRFYEQRLAVNTNPAEATGTGDYAQYDSIYRLTRFRQDVASAGLDSIPNNAASATEPSSPFVKDFNLDGVSNRISVVEDGNTTDFNRELGGATRDAEMNQYTTVGSDVLHHDGAGNMFVAGGNSYFWDYTNQLTELFSQTGAHIEQRYDAFGRRIAKVGLDGVTETVLFWCDGDRVLEETDAFGNQLREYVDGNGIDEHLQMRTADVADLDGDTDTAEIIDLYYHDNSIGSVVALSDSSGSVAESYRFEVYGAHREILDQGGSPVAITQIGNPYGFTGRRHDIETVSDLIFYRARFLDPQLGRFVSRDPIGLWKDELGSAFTYAGANPFSRVDPLGLFTEEEFWTEVAKIPGSMNLWEELADKYAFQFGGVCDSWDVWVFHEPVYRSGNEIWVESEGSAADAASSFNEFIKNLESEARTSFVDKTRGLAMAWRAREDVEVGDCETPAESRARRHAKTRPMRAALAYLLGMYKDEILGIVFTVSITAALGFTRATTAASGARRKVTLYHGTDDVSAADIRRGIKPQGADPDFHMTMDPEKAMEYAKARVADRGKGTATVVKIEIDEEDFFDMMPPNATDLLTGETTGSLRLKPAGMDKFNQATSRN